MATGISDDMIMMYVIHDALRRDLEHLTRAVESKQLAEPGRRDAVDNGWTLFKTQLHHHHDGEDAGLWPAVRAKLVGRPDDLALLDEMEAEHARVNPAIDAIDAAAVDGESGQDRLAEATAAFRTVLVDHLDHEERDTVPMVESVMTKADWKDFSKQQQKTIGFKGAADFFPYILSGADRERSSQAVARFPPPLRFVIRRIWQPRYQRRALWT